MSTPTEEITVDIDAADAEAARKAAEASKKTANGADIPEIELESVAPEPARPTKTELTPTEGIAKLQKQLNEEKAARIAAENRAHEASQGEVAARTDVQKTQLDLVTSAIERVTAANDTLESQYADAMTAQDFKAAAKVQRQMSDNSAKLAQLEAGKSALEKAPKPTLRAAVDPVEQWISNIAPEFPRSKEWVRAHPEFARDNHKQQQMIAAHQFALAKGLKADSDDYFKSIEKTLDITATVVHTDPPADDPMADAAKPVNGTGRQAAPAAPVSRSSSGNGGGSRPNVVKLTPAEVEIAGNMGMTVEEYARNKVALKKEGKLS
jgi:hypothetical protein